MLTFNENRLISPADKVITKIKALINSGVLKPGDKLPPERKMAADFGFGRTHIREALHKLEFYGIINTLPQSGSVLNGLDINTLDGLISDILKLQDYDFYSLVETRFILEVNSASLCALRWKEEDMAKIEKAHKNFIRYFNSPDKVSYDFAFHRAIAEASHNPIIKAMLLVVTPDIMTVYEGERICVKNTTARDEHSEMIIAIKKRDADLAYNIMAKHLQGVLQFAKNRIQNESADKNPIVIRDFHSTPIHINNLETFQDVHS